MVIGRPAERGGREAALLEALGVCGVVPVVRLPRPDIAVPLARALRDAGLPCLEVTFRAGGAGEAIAAIRREMPEVVVGAGTVLTIDQAREALDAGAAFVVSPGTNPSVVEHVLSQGTPMIPGVATPTEIEANLSRGITTMKLFPAEVLGGVAFLRAVRGPYPGVRFMPTGGVTAANLAAYLTLPNVVACGGTWIAPVERLEGGDMAAVAALAAVAAAIVRAARPTGSAG
jgi:2-dehydro-3-deoxyphosphogluconate aldolase/(4S)-4-hydroxy-2-oxoglutarate aldolase